MKIIATFGVLCASVLVATADTNEQKKRFEQEFKHIPIPELPAHAAAIVKNTPAAERSQAAIIAVETVVARHPAAASSVVSAISKAAPEVSAAAVAAATRVTPQNSANIEIAARIGANAARPAPAGTPSALNHNGSPNGNANGGVGHGPGPNKPGNPVVHDRPINTVLPNGKPRHFPPDPPRRPVTPPRPHQYSSPKPN